MTAVTSIAGQPQAAPEDVGMSSTRLANLTRLVQGYIDDGKLAGAVSLVARHDKVVHFETYGMQDAEASRPMQPDTLFRIASMTKPIASVALMSLYEDGRFQLDTPIAEFIPAFKDVKVFAGGTAASYDVRTPARRITLRDCLTHTAGFEALGADEPTPVTELYIRAGMGPIQAQGTLADRAAALASLPLAYDPGTRFTYHYATDIVGRICEVVSGRPFDALLQERILEPLGMTDTSFRVPSAQRDRFAASYDFTLAAEAPRFRLSDVGWWDVAYEESATFCSAGGGLVSTAGDYLRFCRMLARGGELDGERILGTRTLRYMTANHLPGGVDLAAMGQPVFSGAPMSGVGFGLGFAVLLDPTRSGTLGSPGEYFWGGAFSTAFFVSPADDLIAIFLTQLLPNSMYPNRRELRTTVYQAITD